MGIYNGIELVATYVLFVWSCGLAWGSWRVQVMRRELSQERAELRRWVRIKGLWERQERGRWQ
jgi:hypothetical protein